MGSHRPTEWRHRKVSKRNTDNKLDYHGGNSFIPTRNVFAPWSCMWSSGSAWRLLSAAWAIRAKTPSRLAADGQGAIMLAEHQGKAADSVKKLGHGRQDTGCGHSLPVISWLLEIIGDQRVFAGNHVDNGSLTDTRGSWNEYYLRPTHMAKGCLVAAARRNSIYISTSESCNMCRFL